jgi:endonuclease/exonuclease/phosphatase family metal-dependent hydrolase
MSFNIRFATPKDLANGWPFRKDLLFKTIEAFGPDLVGLQEVLTTQRDDLIAHFGKGYDFLGVPRNDGKTAGEIAGILFRRDRFEKVRDGHFWLSPTPEVPGSKGWDADLTRIVTWVELRDHRNADRTLLYFNTHFDHLGKVARVESAKLMRRRIVELSNDAKPPAVIVTGDFNVGADSAPYKEMLGLNSDSPPRLTDTYRELHPQPTTQDFTWHGFVGTNAHPSRIDWILRSDAFQTVGATIDRANDNGRYPSDHFPVEAVLRWKE